MYSTTDKNGKKTYHKINLTRKSIDNFIKLDRLGIGIHVKDFSYSNGKISM